MTPIHVALAVILLDWLVAGYFIHRAHLERDEARLAQHPAGRGWLG